MKGKRPDTPVILSKLEYFNAFGENDIVEGKAGRHPLGSFLKEDRAVAAARGKGVFGRDGDVERVSTDVIMYTDPASGRTVIRRVAEEIDVRFVDADPAVERALAKLDDADIKALAALGLRAR